MADPVLVEHQDSVATLTLNRPEALNALDFAMMEALVAQTSALAADSALRVVIVRGAGRHFMAGGDLRTFATRLDQPPDARRAEFQSMIERLHAAIEHLHRMPAIVVAQARGAVAGFGLSLLCACDLAVAADDAYFTTAYRHIALTPDGGGTWALPRIVGLRKAMEMLLLSERIDAQEALRVGLVNRIAPREEFDALLAEYTTAITTGAPLTIKAGKRIIREVLKPDADIDMDLCQKLIKVCFESEDYAEGRRAFMEKRKPVFKGK